MQPNKLPTRVLDHTMTRHSQQQWKRVLAGIVDTKAVQDPGTQTASDTYSPYLSAPGGSGEGMLKNECRFM